MASNLVVPAELLAATAATAALPPFPSDCAVESSPSQAASTPKRKLKILRAGDAQHTTTTTTTPAAPTASTTPETPETPEQSPPTRTPSTPERQQTNTGNKKQKGGKGAKNTPRSPTKQGTAGNPQKAAAAAEKKSAKQITIQRPSPSQPETPPQHHEQEQEEQEDSSKPKPQPKGEGNTVGIYSFHQMMAIREHDPALPDELQERMRTLFLSTFSEHVQPERPQSPSQKQSVEGAGNTGRRGAGEGAKSRQKGSSSRSKIVPVDAQRRYTIDDLLEIKRGMTHFGPAIPSLRAIRLKRRERFWDSPAAPTSGVSSAFLAQDDDDDDSEYTMEAMSRATMEESLLEERLSLSASPDTHDRAEDPLFGSSSARAAEADSGEKAEPRAGHVSPFASILGETSPASAAFAESEPELESPFASFTSPHAAAASPSVFPPMPPSFVLAGGDLAPDTRAHAAVSQSSLLSAFGVAEPSPLARSVPPLPVAASVAVEGPVDLLALSASQGPAAGLPPLPPAVAAVEATTPGLPALPATAVFESGSDEAASLPALPEGAIVVGTEVTEGNGKTEGSGNAAATTAGGTLPALPEGASVASIDELESVSVSAPATPVKAQGRAPRKCPMTPQERSRAREERERLARQRRALRYLAQSNPASVAVSETLGAGHDKEDEEGDEGDEEDEEGGINVHVGVDAAAVHALYHGRIAAPESPQRRSAARAHEEGAAAPAIAIVFEGDAAPRAGRAHRQTAPAQSKKPTAADFPPLGAPQEAAHAQTVVLVRTAEAPVAVPEPVPEPVPVPVPQPEVAPVVVETVLEAPAAATAEDEMMAFFMQ